MDDPIPSPRHRLELFPADREAFEALARQASTESRWDDLAALYEGRLVAAGDAPDAAALRLQLGILYLEQLGDPARAAAQLERVRAAEPDRVEPLEALASAYRSLDRPERLAEVLERRAELSTGPERADALMALAGAQEGLGRIAEARRALGEAVAADPARPEPLRRARALAERAGDVVAAADLLEQELEVFGDAGLAEAVEGLGVLLAEEPWERDRALRFLAQARRLGRTQAEAVAQALEEQPRTWRDLARSLRAEAVDAREKSAAARAYLRIAQLHALYTEDGAAVAENLERVFLLQPGSEAALDFLERLHGGREDWPGLADAYERIARGLKDRRAAARVLARLARLQASRLQDREAAAASYRRALELDPTRADAADALVGILERKGAWADAVAVLERRLAAAGDTAEKVALRVRLARLAGRHLDDAEQARVHYDAALRLDPRHVEAGREVEPLHREAGDAQGLVRALEAQLAGPVSGDDRRRILERLADAQAALGRPRAEADALGRALALSPGRERLISRLSRAAASARAHGLEARALAVAADLAEAPEDRRRLLLKLAQVRERDMADPTGAAEVYRRVLEARADDTDAQAGLERVLGTSGATGELTDALTDGVEAAAGQEERRAALAKLAHHHEAAGRLDAARLAWAELATEAPDDPEAHLALARVLDRLGDAPAQARALSEALSRLEGEAQADVRQRLADLYARELDRPGDAAALFAELFENDPRRPGLVPALEALYEQGVAPDRIAPLLEPWYAQTGDWPRHLALLEHRLAGLSAPAERAALLGRMADVLETRLMDHRRALEVVARALQETPEDARLVGRLEALARDTGAWEVLDRALSEALVRGLESRRLGADRILVLRERLATLREKELADIEGAAALWLEVLHQAAPGDPAQRRALSALARMAREGERWYDLAEALQRLADLAGGTAEAAELRLEQADVLLDRLDRPQAAARVYEQALAEGGDPLAILPRLTRALAAAGDLEGQARVLEQRIALAESAGDASGAARLKLQHARLLSEGLGAGEQAVASFRAVLVERPGDPDALAALERLLEDPALKVEAAEALAPAYERAQEYPKLARVLAVGAEAAGDPRARAAILRKLAAVQERHLRKKPDALATLGEAVVLEPDDAALRRELRRLADEIGALQTVPDVLDRALPQLEGPAALPLMREAAEWTENRMEDPAEATRRYEAILALDAENLDALRALHRLHRAAGRHEALADVGMRLAEAVWDDAERLRLWREAGRIREEVLQDPAAAVEAWARVLDSDPDDPEVPRRLDRLYQGLERWEDLARILEVQRARAEDPPRRRDLAARLAALRHARLGELEGALALWDEVLQGDPAHPEAREALTALAGEGGPAGRRAAEVLDPHLARAGDHRARIALREARLGEADRAPLTPAEEAQLLHEIRVLYEEGLDAPEMAFMVACRQLQAGLEMDTAREEAERLAALADTAEELVDVYEEVARRLEEDDPRKLDLLRRVARLLTGAGRHDEAIEAWKRVQQLAPADRGVLDELEKLYNRRRDAADLVELYRQKADLVTEPGERAATRLELARLLEEAGEGASAADVLEAVAADSRAPVEAQGEALGRLRTLYERAERWNELAKVLARVARLRGEGPARLEALAALGRLFERHDKQPLRALDLYRAVLDEAGAEGLAPEAEAAAEVRAAVEGLERLLQAEPTRTGAAERLEPVYRTRGDARRLVEALEIRLAASREPEARLAFLREIAALYEETLAQKPLAFMVWCRAFREAPEDADVRARLEALAGATDGWEEVAGLYEESLELLPAEAPASVRAGLYRRLARVHEQHLGRLEHAAAFLDAAVRLEPDDLEARRELARLQEETGAAEGLVRSLGALAEREAEPGERRALWVRAAQVSERELGDRAAAIDAWRRVLGLDPAAPDPRALAELARLLEEEGRWADLIEIEGRRAELARAGDDPLEVADRRQRMGRIRQVRLDDPAGAAADYAAALEADAHHAGALESLEELLAAGPGAEGPTGVAAARAAALLAPRYAEQGDAAGRIRALEVLAAAEADDVEQARILAEIADLHAGERQDPEMAFMTAVRALRARPGDLSLLERLDRLAEAGELEEEEAEVLEELLPSLRDDAVRVRWLRRLGELLSEAGELDRAVPVWRALLERAPGNVEALDRLARLLRLRNDAPGLAEVLRRRIEATEDREARAGLLRQLAGLQSGELEDPEGALATWRRVLADRPDDREALARMEALCVGLERWEDLEDVLGREAQAAAAAGDRSAQADYLHRLGVLSDERLGRPDAAMTLFREVLRIAPGHPGSVGWLESLLEADPGRVDVAQVLEEVYRAQEQWPRLLAALEVRAAHEDAPADRAAVLAEMAGIQERRLGADEVAFVLLCRAFNEHQTPERRAELERLAEQTGQFDELVGVVEDALDRVDDPASAVELQLLAGRVLDERLDRPEEAIAHYETARDADPARIDALRALDRLYRKQARWAELHATLRDLADRVEAPEERATLLQRRGRLGLERLELRDEAAADFRRVLEIAPGHAPALRALESLYEAAEAHEPLAANLEAQLESAGEPADRRRLLARLAEVRGAHLGDVEGAIGLWREVLDLDPASDDARVALEALYQRAGRWEDLAALLRERLAHTVDPREITRLHDRLGWVLATRLESPDAAVAAYRAVLERDPRNEKALESLWDLYEAGERWDELVTVLKRLAPLQENAEGVRRVRFRLAEVLGDHLGRPEEAVETARRLLEVEPRSVEGLEDLEGLLRRLGAAPDAVRAMELRASLLAAEAPEEEAARDALETRRVDLLRAIARAHAEELGAPGEGAPALETLLSLRPDDAEAYETLRGLYEAEGRWRELTTLLEARLERLGDPVARLALQREVAALQEERLGRKPLAFLVLGRAFAEHPEDAEVEADLFRLAEETGGGEELAVVLEEIAEEQPVGPLKAHLYLRLAQLQDGALDAPDDAEASLREVLSFDPAHPGALDALAGLFVRRGEPQRLVVALEQKLEATGEPEGQREVLVRIAEVQEKELGDLDEAVVTWQRVLELDGAEPRALAELVRLHELREDWPALAEALARRAEQEPDDRARARLRHRQGLVREERLGDDDGAVAAWRAALAHDPALEAAVESLERVYTRLERWSELLQTYQTQVGTAAGAPERVRLYLKIAALHENQFDQPAAAVAAYDRVLEEDADHLGALRALERLLRSLGDWKRLIAVLEKHLSLADEPDERVQLHVALGGVWHEALKRVDKAEQLFRQALEIDPGSRPALRALADLYERSGNWVDALEMLAREAKRVPPGSEAVTLWLRMAHIHEDMLLDGPAARDAYERVLEMDPGHLDALQALERLAEGRGDWREYLDSLTRQAEHAPELEEQVRILVRIGRFHLERHQDEDAALAAFEAALEKIGDDLGAAEAAASIHLGHDRWEAAEPLVATVCRQLEARGEAPRALAQWWYKLGWVRQRMARTEPALDAFRRAYEHGATWLPALEGLGAALVATERWEEALKVYQTILIHHRDSVTDVEVVEYYWQLGELNRRLGQLDRAEKNFGRALEIEPAHEASLSAVVALLEAQGRWDEAVEYRHRLLDALEGEDRYEMQLAIGRLARENLDDPYQAIDAYRAAHGLAPDRAAPLDALRGLYRETRQWSRAVEVLEKLVALPEVREDGARYRRLVLALADLLRDEVRDVDRASRVLNDALDVDYTFADAFARIEEMLSRQRRWKDLEANYARMIERLPKTEQTWRVRQGLWRTLAELYQKVLKDPDNAILAWRVVARANAEDAEAHETLAGLLADRPGGEAEAEAVAAWQRVLLAGREPAHVARGVLRLATARQDYERAFAAASVLAQLLGEADPEERQLQGRLAPYGPKAPKASLTDRLWTEHLRHPRLDGAVGRVLELVWEEAGPALARDPKALGLVPRRDLVDPASSMLFFANVYRQVGSWLGQEGVPLYQRADAQAPLSPVPTWPVSLVASEEMLGRSQKKRLTFSVAKALAFARPDLAPARLFDLETLDVFLQAAISLVRRDLAPTADPKRVEKTARLLERALSPEAVTVLKQALREWRPDPGHAALRRWAEGVEHTANRVGALLAGDLEAARAALAEDPGGAARLSQRARLRELAAFCLSDDWIVLRRRLGLALEIPS